jgi:response regulator RpfG family c-di-GMP phosphodiesterase
MPQNHQCIHAHIYVYMHISMYTCTYLCIHAHIYVYMQRACQRMPKSAILNNTKPQIRGSKLLEKAWKRGRSQDLPPKLRNTGIRATNRWIRARAHTHIRMYIMVDLKARSISRSAEYGSDRRWRRRTTSVTSDSWPYIRVKRGMQEACKRRVRGV